MFFGLLTLLSALSLAACAGWFSIIGLLSIYSAAPLNAALVLGVVLELAKLVTTSWLYRNWDYSPWKLRLPLIWFTMALMFATSIGAYGFLAKSHLGQGESTINNSAKIERLDQQIASEKLSIADNEKVIAQLDSAINSYIGKDKTDRAMAIRRAQAPQRKQLRTEIDNFQKKIDEYSETKLKLTSEVRAIQLEVGPIRYVAELFYGTDAQSSSANIEAAVKMFTLLIVLTLDPLAITLLVAANHTLLRYQNGKTEKSEAPTSTYTEESAASVYAKDGSSNDTTAPKNALAEVEAKIEDVEITTSAIVSSRDKETKMDTSLSKEVLERPVEVNEEENTILDIEELSKVTSPPDNIEFNEAHEESGNSTGTTGVIFTVEGEQSADSVSEKEIRDYFKNLQITAMLPAIKTPALSRAEIENTNSMPLTPVDTKDDNNYSPIAVRQSAVLRELIGNIHHEKEEAKVDQIDSMGDREIPKSATQEIARFDRLAESTSSQENGPSSLVNDKYPKVLSWLKEFKGN